MFWFVKNPVWQLLKIPHRDGIHFEVLLLLLEQISVVICCFRGGADT
jgi:hypothetical protein